MTARAMRLTLVLSVFLGACSASTEELLSVVPHVKEASWSGGIVDLAAGFSVMAARPDLRPLAEILADDFYLLTGIRNDATDAEVAVRLDLDDALGPEEYRLSVGDDIAVVGGDYAAVSMGLVTLLQAMQADGTVPRLEVSDRPDLAYRGVMLDLARAWHDIDTLEDVIELCRWYKINYLHLHLTDDQSFTFPSTAYPALATEGRHYSVEELRRLDQFAFERGVTLVPEIDVPGHATQFVAKMPELFGIGDPSANSYTITMGRDATYEALETLLGEVAEVFEHSPYIHVGGDEAFFAGMEDDPETVAYMTARGIETLDGLFRHFIGRLDEMVQARDKQTIVWAGFGEEGEGEVSRDIVVMLWESQYYDPQRLIDDGFRVINASFKPLYVVNNRKWDPEYIYTQWNPRRWESWTNEGERFVGVEVRPTERLLGASMSAWEQDQTNQVSRLRSRLPAMSEHLWNDSVPDASRSTENIARADGSFGRLLRPFVVRADGMVFPDAGEGLFLEHRWFAATARVEPELAFGGLALQYTIDGSAPTLESDTFDGPLEIEESTVLTVQAFDTSGEEVGSQYRQRFLLSPLTARTEGLSKDLPRGSWEKHRFEGRMALDFDSALPGDVRVTVDGSWPDRSAPLHTSPLTLERTTTVRAQLFDDSGAPVGLPFGETYYIIVDQPSLTTGKPIWATNEEIRPGLARLANNGRVTLWEQWGGHVGEEVWITVDLEAPEPVRRLLVQNFWDGRRYYQYTIDGSLDGDEWFELVDFSENRMTATIEGYEHLIEPTETRFLRINLLYNSANPGLHLVEFSAYR